MEATKKKPKKADSIIRVGDWIEIENPAFFVRCGYPKTVESETAYVTENFADDIHKLIIKTVSKGAVHPDFGLKPASDLLMIYPHDDKRKRLFEKMAREIAYTRCKVYGFGGNKREVYTQDHPELKGRQAVVERIKFVKSGEYYAPSGGYSSYYDEYDYEPGGIYNQKTHKILYLSYMFGGVDSIAGFGMQVGIESIHVKKCAKNDKYNKYQ